MIDADAFSARCWPGAEKSLPRPPLGQRHARSYRAAEEMPSPMIFVVAKSSPAPPALAACFAGDTAIPHSAVISRWIYDAAAAAQ